LKLKVESTERRKELTDAIRKSTPKSGGIYKRALEVLPGGEVSGVRMFDPWPFYATKAEGAYIWDVDGNKYLDCCMCYGVLFLGHRPKPVLKALEEQMKKSLHYGAPLEGEVELAEKFVKCVPCAERLIICNTGNESIHKSIAIARAYSGKDKVAKFEGCFHGSNEYSFWSVVVTPELRDLIGPDERPELVPMCAGMPKYAKDSLVLLPHGHEAAFDLIEENASDLAVVMLEVVNGPGTIAFDKEYLRKLREVTRKNNVLLLFDEVITGFRLGLGGGQELFDVIPDIATFGKAMAGGTAIGAIGTRWDILDKCLDLMPPIQITGTFSGNAMTVAAANASLDFLMAHSPGIYNEMNEKGDRLRSTFNSFAETNGYPARMSGISSMFQVHMMDFLPTKPRDFLNENDELKDEFALRLRVEGVFLPYPLHLAFISPAHSDEDIDEILRALEKALVDTFEGR